MLINSMNLMNMAVKAAENYSATPTKENAYTALCRLRMTGIRLIMEHNAERAKFRDFERRKAKAAAVLPLGVRVRVLNPHRRTLDRLRTAMQIVGKMICLLLDDWQKFGAEFGELCNLCNISERQGAKAIEGYEMARFSEMIFVNSLDYKNTGSFIEDIPEAPLTICIKEFMLHQMTHTDHGQRAAHEALKAAMPELWENAVIQSPDGGFEYADSDGVIHHIDSDGVEI